MKKRDATQIIREFPASEPIVAMIEFNETIFVATSKSVYRYRPKSHDFRKVMFVASKEGMIAGQDDA